MEFKEIIEKLKELIIPLLIFTASFTITVLITIGVFIQARAVDFDTMSNLLAPYWVTALQNAELTLTALGVAVIVLIIASLAGGFTLWGLRNTYQIKYNTYIVYALMAVAGAFLEIILNGMFLKIIW